MQKNLVDTASNRELPPLPRIVLNDVAIFTAVVFPVVLWCLHGLYFIASRLDNTEPELPIELPVIATAIGSAVALWKLSVIRALFRSGRAAEGVVTSCLVYKTGLRVDYEFEVDGMPERGAARSTLPDRANLFPKGRRVSVLYDPTRPRRSLVREIFDDRSTAHPGPEEASGGKRSDR